MNAYGTLMQQMGKEMNMSSYDEIMPEMDEIPPSDPIGSVPISFNVPVPTIEQVCGHVARQVLESAGYRQLEQWQARMEDAIQVEVDRQIAAHATAAIEAALHFPLQPTDGFGRPIGDKTDIATVINSRVSEWVTDSVDSQGRVKQPTHYDKTTSRLEWLLGQIIDRQMMAAVDKEVKNIVAKLKGDAVGIIAKQIAERVAGTVLK